MGLKKHKVSLNLNCVFWFPRVLSFSAPGQSFTARSIDIASGFTDISDMTDFVVLRFGNAIGEVFDAV